MNYKKILTNQNFRLKLLGLTEFIPDKWMIAIQYKMKTGRKLNLKNPRRYNEKIQWYKLNYRDPLMTECTDKFKVREYVKNKGLGEILIPLYGSYDKAEEINFEKLPNKFVIKTNNGGGSSTNIICKNKEKLNLNKARKTINSWLTKRTVKAGREWSYYNIEPKIICEKLLESNSENGLIDYKFYCFDGEPYYLKVVTDATSNKGPKNGIYNMSFEQLQYCRTEVDRITEKIDKPRNFDLMCEIARELSEDFPHVRVDLYNLNGKIYFGELTFYDTSGYQIFEPDEFDFMLGDLFKIDKMMF